MPEVHSDDKMSYNMAAKAVALSELALLLSGCRGAGLEELVATPRPSLKMHRASVRLAPMLLCAQLGPVWWIRVS